MEGRVPFLSKFSNAGRQNIHSGSERHAKTISDTESVEVFAFSWDEIRIIRTTKGKVKCKFAKLASESKLAIGTKTKPMDAIILKGIVATKVLE